MSIRGSVDLGGRSADDVEREGSSLEPGWARATVQDLFEKEGSLFFEFRLADGRIATDVLWDPNRSESPAKLVQRRSLYSIRLGLVPREAKDTVFEFDWLDAIGRECALELALAPMDDKGRRFVKPTWAGLFALDDPRVPTPIRTREKTFLSAADAAALNEPKSNIKGHKTQAAPPSPPPASSGYTAPSPAAARQSALNLDDL